MINILEELYNASNWYEIYDIIQKYNLPTLLSPVQYNSYQRYPLWHMAPIVKRGIEEINLDDISGDNWNAGAVTDKHPPGYPKYRKVANMLETILLKNRELPPIEVFEISGEYFVSDGKHRIYCCRLLGYKAVKARVFEVKYKEMLENAVLEKEGGITYLAITGDGGELYHLHEVDAVEETRLKELGVLLITA